MTSEAEETEVTSPEKSRKHRNEKKNVDKALLEQIEFYFSDANLNKDKFLSELIGESEDDYIDISVFLKFNKVKALTNNVENIVKAISKSTFLKVSEDRKLVKRITPILVNEEVDKCTIYVENLPSNADHDWVRERFNGFGKITYVSLPKFRISKKIKGFSFVEFASIESAESACKSFNKTEEKPSEVVVKKEVVDEGDEEPAKKRVKLEEPETKTKAVVEPVEKKRRNRRKKQKNQKEELNLRVISKLEWKRFRNKFLTLQKANMAELKKYLTLHQDQEETEEPESKAQAPQFAPNLIVKLNYDQPVKDAKKMRGELKAVIGVRYVELEEDAVCGYIRCDCAEITESVLQSVQTKTQATVIHGEEERMYWNKIKEDRDKKISGKQIRTKKRGFDKIIHKAIKINMEKTASHIRFDE